MTAFSTFFRQVASLAVLVFVTSSMLNVGLTQRPSMIREHLTNWHLSCSAFSRQANCD